MRVASNLPGVLAATEPLVHPALPAAQVHELLAVLAAQAASLEEIRERFAVYLRELQNVDVRFEHRRVGEGSPLWLGKDLDPEIWVMTPGRGNVFGLVMNKRQGFFYPWPEPRSEKAAPAKMARLREIHRPYERAHDRTPDLADSAIRLRQQTRTADHPPVKSDEHYRHLVAKLAGVEDLDHNPIWWQPEGLPSTQASATHRQDAARHDAQLRDARTREEQRRTEREAEALTDAQRLRRALAERSPYVVPVTLRPDLELASGAAQGDWEAVEPHVARVQAPHDIMAWGRHY